MAKERNIEEEFFKKNNFILVNRRSDARVIGGLRGWKVRINIDDNGEKDYQVKALRIAGWLNYYFVTTCPLNIYSEPDLQGYNKKIQIWKHLDGGEKGIKDFTIYIGSYRDTMKFAQDVESSEIAAIIRLGRVTSETGSSGDCRITDKISGRFDPLDKIFIRTNSINGRLLKRFLKDNGFDFFNEPFIINDIPYYIIDNEISGIGVLKNTPLHFLVNLKLYAEVRDYLFQKIFTSFYKC